MSDAPILTFDSPNKLGKVTSVDTSRVLIAVENAALLPRAAVGSLVAIQGATAQEFLIGMTERVTRQLRERNPLHKSKLPVYRQALMTDNIPAPRPYLPRRRIAERSSRPEYGCHE